MESKIEIERKYIIFNHPDLDGIKSRDLLQGYIFSFHHDQVRLRKRENADDLTSLTVKRGKGELRDEFEIALTNDQFRSLWPATKGKRVRKTRYFYDLDGFEAEIDIYHGNLKPLKTVEVEFISKKQSSTFNRPDWFGPDVTEDTDYKNKQLALEGLPKSFEDYRKLYTNTLT